MVTQISLPLVHQGKVGDVYKAGNGNLLLVRSDRTSGFNVKLLTEIPGKGNVLNQVSQWWMEGPLKNVVANHLSGLPLGDFLSPDEAIALSGRGVIVKKLNPILIEAVVRRHLTGSGYQAYLATGEVCGIKLPQGLKDGDRLSAPIFTPTEKSHDDAPINFQQMKEKIGPDLAVEIRQISMKIFLIAERYLADRGIILVDMKLEYGLDDYGVLTLMDEVLTPDSSRFWLKRPFEASRKIVSLDKQKIRDWMKQQKELGVWDGKSPIALPPDLVSEVSGDYEKIFKRITINPVVGVVMGSESDWPTMKLAVEMLRQFGIPHVTEVVSAHRTPQLLVEYAHRAERRGIKLIIAGAGGAAHLPGMLAAETTLPILGVPIKSSVLSGVDSLYSIVQMPKGVPVATFAIGDAGSVNAALFAVAILAGSDVELSKKLDEFREKQVKTVLAMELPDE